MPGSPASKKSRPRPARSPRGREAAPPARRRRPTKAPTEEKASARSASSLGRSGRGGLASSDSWFRIARSSACSSGLGSRPSSSPAASASLDTAPGHRPDARPGRAPASAAALAAPTAAALESEPPARGSAPPHVRARAGRRPGRRPPSRAAFQSTDLGLRKPFETEIREALSRATDRVIPTARSPRDRGSRPRAGSAVSRKLLEATSVELFRFDPQHVPGRGRDDALAAEPSAQA